MGGKKGILSYIFIICLAVFIISDLFRHALVLFKANTTVVFGLEMRNPFNGNLIAIANHMIADASYTTSTIFFVITLFAFASHGLGEGTILLKTRYLIEYDDFEDNIG